MMEWNPGRVVSALEYIPIPRLRTISPKPYEIPYEGNESTQAARQSIDQQLRDLELKKRSLQNARNRLAPIFVLPPEVLSKIFIFLRDLKVDCYTRHSPTEWVRTAGAICHQLREVALNCPTLWSVPVFTKPELAREMIRRSKKAELTINLPNGVWIPRIMNEVEDAITQIFRIRVLRLSCTSPHDSFDKVFATFSQPAPHLQQVELINTRNASPGSRRFLPDNAFVDAPQLRIVELAQLHFSWTYPIFKHNLISLTVNNDCISDTSTFSELFEALGHMPELQTLSLTQCLPSRATAIGTEPTLNFPALRYLQVSSNIDDCAQFLRCITYPPHTRVRVACTSLTKTHDYTNILTRISEGLYGSSTTSTPLTFRSAKIWQISSNALGVSFFDWPTTIIRPNTFSGLPDGPDVGLQFTRIPNSNFTFDYLLTDICRLFDLNHLEFLELKWPYSTLGTENIQESIGRLPNLKFLCVDTFGSQVIQAIGHNSDAVNFPALKTLYLSNLKLYEITPTGEMDDLIDALIHRANINAPIEKLQIELCTRVRVQQQRLLGQLVVDLEIDQETIDVLELDSEFEVDSEEDEDEDEDEDWGGLDDYDDDYDDDPYGIGWYPPF